MSEMEKDACYPWGGHSLGIIILTKTNKLTMIKGQGGGFISLSEKKSKNYNIISTILGITKTTISPSTSPLNSLYRIKKIPVTISKLT